MLRDSTFPAAYRADVLRPRYFPTAFPVPSPVSGAAPAPALCPEDRGPRASVREASLTGNSPRSSRAPPVAPQSPPTRNPEAVAHAHRGRAGPTPGSPGPLWAACSVGALGPEPARPRTPRPGRRRPCRRRERQRRPWRGAGRGGRGCSGPCRTPGRGRAPETRRARSCVSLDGCSFAALSLGCCGAAQGAAPCPLCVSFRDTP